MYVVKTNLKLIKTHKNKLEIVFILLMSNGEQIILAVQLSWSQKPRESIAERVESRASRVPSKSSAERVES